MKTHWKRKKVYKVVRRMENGELKSAVVSYNSLHYKVNEITKPEFGKIFCFDTLTQAVNFSAGGPMFEIYEAIAYECSIIQSMVYFASEGIFEDFWNSRTPFNYYFSSSAPLGTLGCKRIKLVKKIE